MARTRLSSYIRARLMDLAKDILTFPVEQAACDKAYGPAAKLVKAAMIERFPPNDMEILKRYDCARAPLYVYLVLNVDNKQGHLRFDFREQDDPPLTKKAEHTFLANEKVMLAVTTYNDSITALKQTKETKLKDYAALVNGVGSFEDVEVVWPEAAKIREKLIGGAVSTLNPDVIERIKADVATRKRKR